MSARNLFEEEQGVLCAALADATCWLSVTRALSPRDFTDEQHQHVMAALYAGEPTGRVVDIMAIMKAVRAKHGESLVEYIRDELLDAVPQYGPLPKWVAKIAEASITRRTVTAMTAAVARLGTGENREDVEHGLEQTLAAIRASAPDARVFDDKRLMAASAIAYLDDDSRAGTPYGFAPWDAAVLPAQPSHLVLYGGASGSGKSMTARNTLRAGVERFDRVTGWLTCEMSGEEQLVHLACADAQVPLETYYRRRMSPQQRKAFTTALERWRDSSRLKINEMGTVTPNTALSIFRRWREQGVTNFYLDHLHRLDYGATKSGDDLRVPVAAFAKALKNFAKDSEATVYALVQYSKIKPHEEPGDDKIREANNVLEEADAVFHVYRPNVACERDNHGILHPLTRPEGGRYFEGSSPPGAILAPDREAVYVKLGKQRRRLRDGLIRIPFNPELALMYDTLRVDSSRDAA